MKDIYHIVFHIFLPWVLVSGLKYFLSVAFGLIYLRTYFELRDPLTWLILALGLLGVFKAFEPIEARLNNWQKSDMRKRRNRKNRDPHS